MVEECRVCSVKLHQFDMVVNYITFLQLINVQAYIDCMCARYCVSSCLCPSIWNFWHTSSLSSLSFLS